MSTCKVTGKIGKKTKKKILTHMNRIISRSKTSRSVIMNHSLKVKSVYKCPFCKEWHMTSQEQREY